jgi:integrase
MLPHDAILLTLTGGTDLTMREQHPQVHQRADRKGTYWFFRYWQEESLPDGAIRTTRRFRTIGPSNGPGALTRVESEAMRDRILASLHTAPPQPEAVPKFHQPVDTDAILFGDLAEMWRKDYVENPKIRLAEPTRIKYRTRLRHHILPRWKNVPVKQIRTKAILDWLHAGCTSWYMMVDLRNIMSTIVTKAQEWEVLPDTFANPTRRVRLGRRWVVRPEQILSEELTIQVLARLSDPQLLICETCLSTGARISEVLGLMFKHVDLVKGILHIQQRHCRGDIDVPKTKNSRRVLTLGALTTRYKVWVKRMEITQPDHWLFPQEDNSQSPMWDSGVRKALKISARAIGYDFPGFGLHSLRRANITWRQEVGASSIEASKIAGHSSVNMTNDYTHVQLKRQNELTRAIQRRLQRAGGKEQSTSLPR